MNNYGCLAGNALKKSIKGKRIKDKRIKGQDQNRLAAKDDTDTNAALSGRFRVLIRTCPMLRRHSVNNSVRTCTASQNTGLENIGIRE